MTTAEIKERVQTLIKRGRVEDAAKTLMAWIAKYRPDLEDDFMIIQAQIQKLDDDSMLFGESSDSNQRMAKYTKSVLTFIKRLEEPALTDTPLEPPKPEPPKPEPPKPEPPKPEPPQETNKKNENIKYKLLFSSATPPGTRQLDISNELSLIMQELNDAQKLNEFRIITKFYTKASDLQELLVSEKPSILHFSGHGTNQGLGHASDGSLDNDRIVADPQKEKVKKQQKNKLSGLIVYDEQMRRPQLITATALERLFKLLVRRASQPEIVILNACFADEQAVAISKLVKYVVGTTDAVPDSAAIQFAAGFYHGLAQEMSVEDAFDNAVTRALLTGLEDDKLFVLYKNGVKQEF